jgi:hypothetical protein
MQQLRRIWLCFLAVFAFIHGCGKPSSSRGEQDKVLVGAPLNRLHEEPPTLLFDLKPSAGFSHTGNDQLYDCTYQSHGKIAKFQLEFFHDSM